MRLLKDLKTMAFMLVVLVLVGTAAPVHATTQWFNFTVKPGGGDKTVLAKKDDDEQWAHITTTSVSGHCATVYGAVFDDSSSQMTWDVPLTEGSRNQAKYYKKGYPRHWYKLLGQDTEYNLARESYIQGRWTP